MTNLKQTLLSLDFFEDNEYLDFYCALIEQNLNTVAIKNITEKHHIIQRKLFTLLNKDIDNSKTNLVNLTHFDHCKAHYYLCLCTKGKLKYSNQHSFMRMVKIKDRFENFDYELFLSEADKYNEIYEDFTKHQSKLNHDSCIKRGGGTTHGRHSYTNGVENIFAFECPEGWWPGRIVTKPNRTDEQKEKYREKCRERAADPKYRKNLQIALKRHYKNNPGSASGKIWITNEIEETYIDKNFELPEGWRYGRKKMPEEQRLKISQRQKGKKLGKHTCEKKMWIHNGAGQTLIPISKLNDYLSLGYIVGRL